MKDKVCDAPLPPSKGSKSPKAKRTKNKDFGKVVGRRPNSNNGSERMNKQKSESLKITNDNASKKSEISNSNNYKSP